MTIMVTAADADFFPMLQGLLHSFGRQVSRGSFAISVIDLGLTKEQIAALDREGVTVWPIDRTVLASLAPSLDLAAMTAPQLSLLCRAYLPQIFPHYDVYLWLDADMWVQTPDAIALYLRGAAKGALAITAESDRSYDFPDGGIDQLRFFLGRPWIKHWLYKKGAPIYGRKVGRALMRYRTLNAGAFALRGDAPHWSHWQRSITTAIHKGFASICDQISLNHAVYTEGLAVQSLPATCNWLCKRRMPALDRETGLLVEPALPHQAIGIIHFTGFRGEALQRAYELETTDGGAPISRSLLYAPPQD